MTAMAGTPGQQSTCSKNGNKTANVNVKNFQLQLEGFRMIPLKQQLSLIPFSIETCDNTIAAIDILATCCYFLSKIGSLCGRF